MSFFTKDKSFYRTLFPMLLTVALQNLVTYSVNMADNIMLGSYSQNALSGAATVNQIFFLVQQFTLATGNTLVAISSQYWAKGKREPIRSLTGYALRLGGGTVLCVILLCLLFPSPILHIFTGSKAIVAEGRRYLSIVVFSYLPFVLTQIMMSMLRAVKTVNISFYVSCMSLIVNVGVNYVLIFGKLGFPEMGVRGAAIGTVIARCAELAVVALYLAKRDKKVTLFGRELFSVSKELRHDYIKVFIPIATGSMLWAVSVPMQTAVLGHLTPDAIAANSVATTFYQYLKVVVIAMSSVSSVMIGSSIGKGDMERVRSGARTLSVIDISIGIVLGALLALLRHPLLSFYELSDTAMALADDLILIMSLIMVGMSYQMPVSSGLFSGSGDGKFTMTVNMISTWGIVMPLSFLAAFWLKLPVQWVVVVIQSDQIFKCLPMFLHFRKYRWAKTLTR